MIRAILIATMALLAVANSCPAQLTTGNVAGRLVDGDGAVIDDATIVATGTNLQGARRVRSGSDGQFAFLDLPIGEYRIDVEHPDYHTATHPGVIVHLGQTTSLNPLELTASIHALPDIVVRGQTSLSDPSTASMGNNLTADTFIHLPIERNYRSIAPLLPHVNASFLGDDANFAGGTGLGNRYFIDGVEVTNPKYGDTGTHLPYDFVQEVQVRTGGYEAEYRSSLGGIINVVTPSGGNEFGLRAFGFYINNQFTSGNGFNAFDRPRGDFAHFDAGFTAGGPIQRDRLWYFAAYNPTFIREDVGIPGVGFREDHSTTHSFAGKLTWRAGDRSDVVFTVFGDPTERRAVGSSTLPWEPPAEVESPESVLADVQEGGIHAALSGTHRITDRVQLNALVSRVSVTDAHRPVSSAPLLVHIPTGTWSGGGSLDFNHQSTVSTATFDATLSSRSHTAKVGVAFRDNKTDFNTWASAVYQYGDSSYASILVATKGVVCNRVASGFVQDSWRVTDRMRLNAGLRWDGQYIIGTDGAVAQRILDQWQPRAGFVYLPGARGTHKLVGSFGRFYHELATNPLTVWYSDDGVWDIVMFDHNPIEDPSGGVVVGSAPSGIQPEIDGLKGQHYDEFTLGYERVFLGSAMFRLRGIYRTLREGIETGQGASGTSVFGNPGSGPLDNYPGLTHDYRAVEVSLQHSDGARGALLASYVLSRTHGNYTGLFYSDVGQAVPNSAVAFDWPEMIPNSTGLLPNDRTHVFKLSGFRRVTSTLTAGASFTWQTGTPLSEFGAMESSGFALAFLRQRGTVGRTPSIWDLNLRLRAASPASSPGGLEPTLVLDVLHIGSRETAVNVEQAHYLALDEEGNQTSPNPNYGKALRYQPPMAFRVGIEVAL